jgi:acyl carrier protein
MSRQEIEQKVNEILVDKLGVDPSEVKEDATFTGDLGGDSLDVVDVIIECEHEFGVSVNDAEAEKCVTVKDIYDLVERSV